MTSLTFLGATGQVTGSCYLLKIGGRRILLDCGLFQGSKETEQQNAAALSLQTCFKHSGWNANIPKVGEKIAF